MKQDEEAQQVLIDSVIASGVGDDNDDGTVATVTIADISDISDRRLHELHTAPTTTTVTATSHAGDVRRELQGSGVQVQYNVSLDVTTTSNGDPPAADEVAEASYDAFTRGVSNALSSGTFTDNLQSSGSSLLSNATAANDTFSVSDFTFGFTGLSPTQAPTEKPGSDSSSSDGDFLSIEIVAGLGVGAFVLLLAVGYVLYRITRRSSDDDEDDEDAVAKLQRSRKPSVAGGSRYQAKKITVMPMDDTGYIDLEKVPRSPSGDPAGQAAYGEFFERPGSRDSVLSAQEPIAGGGIGDQLAQYVSSMQPSQANSPIQLAASYEAPPTSPPAAAGGGALGAVEPTAGVASPAAEGTPPAPRSLPGSPDRWLSASPSGATALSRKGSKLKVFDLHDHDHDDEDDVEMPQARMF